ncbi:MAG: hypothetical protein A2X77_05185 [Gammaproteobacteria bacterium GWE2_42_36]|nr:MAG: hypothetical protein A2X77_05185 [Gammaproteobacteria bacterium GWE2_42_36]HCU05656.1 hypothetical protein [Coxiellaceae bacterium]
MSKLLKFVCIGLVSVLIATLSFAIYADPNPGGMAKGMGHVSAGKGQKNFNIQKKNSKSGYQGAKNLSLGGSASRVKFSDKDRVTITNFFSAHPFNSTPLPPGIAKNLARGKPLPPGIAKVFLPDDLTRLLGAYPGYDYLVAGKDVLLVNQSNQIVTSILRNALP